MGGCRPRLLGGPCAVVRGGNCSAFRGNSEGPPPPAVCGVCPQGVACVQFRCLQSRLRPPCLHPIEGRGGKGSSVPAARLCAPVLFHQPSFSARPWDSVSLHRDARLLWASLQRPGCRMADSMSRHKCSELFQSPDESTLPATPSGGGEGPRPAGDTGVPTRACWADPRAVICRE